MFLPQYVVKAATKTAITNALPQVQALHDALGAELLSPGSHIEDARWEAEELLRVLRFLQDRVHLTADEIQNPYVEGGTTL